MSNIRSKLCSIIKKNTRVLDLGCGDASLLHYLSEKLNVHGYGIEQEPENIKQCLKKGQAVYQGNLDDCLTDFMSKSYDTVILSHTLQEVAKPLDTLSEMLRIGHQGIVIFPNFAFWLSRLQLAFGWAPKYKPLAYEWYNTPNVRVITIKDFKKLCKEKNYQIIEENHLYDSKLLNLFMPKFLGNLCCQKALFVMKKND
eukprot:COSAG01_NODE_2503_length_7555_cov_3.547881_7_plen_199_part_00